MRIAEIISGVNLHSRGIKWIFNVENGLEQVFAFFQHKNIKYDDFKVPFDFHISQISKENISFFQRRRLKQREQLWIQSLRFLRLDQDNRIFR